MRGLTRFRFDTFCIHALDVFGSGSFVRWELRLLLSREEGVLFYGVAFDQFDWHRHRTRRGLFAFGESDYHLYCFIRHIVQRLGNCGDRGIEKFGDAEVFPADD